MPAQTPPDPATLIARIDALLPQTQCGLCQTPGCRPYAEAIAAGEAINRCVPGGQVTVDAIAALLDRPSEPVDTTHGTAAPHRLVALIREDECIGCTKCIQACPVDAIVGAAKLMHTVLIEECTGCNLCLPPCPVDCIDLVPGPDIPTTWHRAAVTGRIPLIAEDELTPAELAAKARADHARSRHEARLARLATAAAAKAARRREKLAPPAMKALVSTAAGGSEAPSTPTADAATLMIAAAMARSQLKKAEKQLAALEARGEDIAALRDSLPGLQAAVTAAEAALAAGRAR